MHMIMPARRRRSTNPFQMQPFFSMPFATSFPKMSTMPTDITSTEDGLEMTMELPGFSKDDVTVELKDGYLTIQAKLQSETEEQPQAEASAEQTSEQNQACTCEQTSEQEESCTCEQPKQSWVRRERFFGSCSRSFYVGEDIEEDAVTARFENGLLKVSVPRKAQEPEPETKKLIEIQG